MGAVRGGQRCLPTPREGRRPAMGVEEKGMRLNAAAPPAFGNWLFNKGKRCKVSDWLWGGHRLWEVYREGLNLLANCTSPSGLSSGILFCVGRKLYIFCLILLEKISLHTMNMNPWILSGCQARLWLHTFEIFSFFMQLLFADLPSAD